jgi:hypothetical protein
MNLRNEKSNVSMTNCRKTGIKINKTKNDYVEDPFAGIDPFKNRSKQSDYVENLNLNGEKKYELLDLDINNYSREELYKLFGFRSSIMLTDENIKEAKQIVLKTHPDKSNLENKYFIFFTEAFRKLKEIYEFQNKTNRKNTQQDGYTADVEHTNTYINGENKKVLDKMLEKSDLKNTDNFNKWFNNQFDKHKLEDPLEKGYGDWLKSEEDIVYMPQNINKDKMTSEINKRKNELKQLVPYKGVENTYFSSSNASALMEYDGNFSSGSLFTDGNNVAYTDLRQAYVESVIPVTEDDFNKMPQFKNMNEYNRHRNSVDITPTSKEDAMHQLYLRDRASNEESAALAFYYAEQSEKNKKNSQSFWSALKQIAN